MPPTRGLRGARSVPSRQSAKQSREAPLSMMEADVDIHVESLAASGSTAPVNILIHGPSGHGKTLLAGGAADGTRDVTFLSTETEGVASARAVGSQAKLMRCPSWEHAVAGVKYAEQHFTVDDWLVVDSGTKMQEMYMRWILQRENDLNPQRDLDIPAIQNHQKYQNGFKRWTDRLIDGNFNVIFITTSMTADDAEGEERIIPHLLGKKGEISDYVSSQFSVALYYSVARESREMRGPVLRRALAQPYPPWYAKDRFMALGKFWNVEEGSYFEMSKMIQAIEKAKSKDADTEEDTAPQRTTRAGRSRRAVRGVAS
jgi:hypothetical protein